MENAGKVEKLNKTEKIYTENEESEQNEFTI